MDRRLRNTSEIRQVVAAAGWEIVGRVVENGLVVEGRTFDVTRFQARTASLCAYVVVFRDCVDESTERLELGPSSPPYARRQIGTTKIRVEVIDEARAVEELEYLNPSVTKYQSFANLQAAVEARGWQVISSREDSWDFCWSIHATRSGDDLDIYAAPRMRERQPIHVDMFGRACLDDNVSWTLRIRSSEEAERLAEALVREQG
jgi:hypothetical protein